MGALARTSVSGVLRMKRFLAVCLAASAVGVSAVPVASADSSSPPNCFGGEISTGATSGPPGSLGAFISGYAHFFNSMGTSLGQTGIPFAKAACPVPPPPPPS
jgi:hypothetical protein